MQTFSIPSGNWETLMVRIDKLSRRAVKLGISPPVLNKIGEHDEVIDAKRGTVRTYFDVQLESQPIVINDWQFAATIDIADDPSVGRVLNRVPGVLEDMDLPAQYRNTTDYCDHCRRNRRRNSVFILHNPNEGWKQVGRTCLKDFFGQDPKDMLAYMEMLVNIDGLCNGAQDPGFFGFSPEDSLDLQNVLSFTAFVIEKLGWVSKKFAMEYNKVATSYYVSEAYFCPTNLQATLVKDLIEEYDSADKSKYQAIANQTIEWVRSQDESQSSDFIHNCMVICKKDTLSRKHLPLACALIVVAQPKAEKVEKPVSKHVGTVGSRETMELTVKDIKFWANNFNGVHAIFFEDANNNQIVWKASNNPDLNVGNTYRVVAGVKSHDFYKNIAQTQITRAKIVGAVAKS